MAYLDAAKIAALLKTVGPASFRRAMMVLLPEVNTAIQTDAAAGLEALPATPGTLEASKLIQVDADKHIDVIETASLKLGASGATTAVTATAAELNQLAGKDFADEFAQFEGLADELAALAAMDTELGLLAGLTVNAATLNALNSNPGKRALNVLNIDSDDTAHEDTITIGADVYEVNLAVAYGGAPNIELDLEASATKAQGTLTMDTQPTSGDTMTIDTKVYTFVPDGTANADGEVDIGADLAEAKLNVVGAVNGAAPQAHNDAHTTVSAAAFSGNDSVMTALAGGVAGNAIATTETFTAGTNVFDAGTLGTTTAGVDPLASAVTDSLIAAINASAVEAVAAVDIGTAEVLLIADAVGVVTLACSETLTGSGIWAAANMYGGAAAAGVAAVAQSRVPLAVEVTLGNMHFQFDFAPSYAVAMVRVTAGGAVVAWDGALTIVSNRVSIDNSGAVDWAVTDTVYILAYA